ARTTRSRDLRALFAAGRPPFCAVRGGGGGGLEAAVQAFAALTAEARERRGGGPLAPVHLGPLAALAMRHPDGREVVLLGSMHTSYMDGEFPVAAAIREAVGLLQPSVVVAELDEDRATDAQLFPQSLRAKLDVHTRAVPATTVAPEGELCMEQSVVARALEEFGADKVPSLEEVRRAATVLWERSSDERCFDNAFYLQAYESQLRGDFARDMRATVQAAADVGAPLILGDAPIAAAFGPAALAETRALFAQQREAMREFLADRAGFPLLEAAKRRVIRGALEDRRGGDQELYVRAGWLLEPTGLGHERMRQGLLEVRDPFLAAAFDEPAARAALEPRAGAGAEGPPLGVAVLGAAHLKGVAAALAQGGGYEPVGAPARGWPELRGGGAAKGATRAGRPRAGRPRKGGGGGFR
ncbi:unnamed protein product, partial [Prorocentrum cordatum]